MKIIIPMSGLGKRFVDAGYTSPKPLIRVHGKPIIEYVIHMIPGENDFIFICNRDHLATTNMKETLLALAPNATIVAVDPHDKGPVHATQFVHEFIKDDEDIFVIYCDFMMDFDFEDMLQKIQVGGYAGAVPSYTGFHPHLIHKKVYGGVLADQNNTMLKYEEKRSFTENPMESHHSAGAYYFRSGKDFKEYSNELMSRDDIRINGEAYTSMIYYLYLRDGKKIYVPEPKYFMQWGTPEDLEEYEAWMRYMSSKHNVPLQETSIPLGREVKVAIPYREDTEQFIKSHEYWENYFKEKLCK